MSRTPGTPVRPERLLLVGCLSHRIPRYSSTPQKLLSPPRPQNSKLRNSTCSYYLTLPPPFIPFIPSLSKPIPTPRGSSQLPLCPSWWSFSNRQLAPRYHTLAHQCRYTKSLGNPTKPHRPHAPQNCPPCLRKRSWGKRPLAHRHTAAPAAPARCRSHSPSAPWRKVAPWSRASEETSSVSPNCPFLHEREESRQIICGGLGGAPNTALLVVCTTPNHNVPRGHRLVHKTSSGLAGELAILYGSYSSSC